jgi:nitroreductase
MDFFEAVSRRRSIRKFDSTPVPPLVLEKAFEAALLAPNSSNAQTWDFFWVRTKERKEQLIRACLSQSAARTAQELVVVTANYRNWRRSNPALIEWVEREKAPKVVHFYYKRLLPFLYRPGPFNVFALIKWVGFFIVGLFRPMQRGPASARALNEVAIKSAALGAENFVLACAAQGFDTCMMEGFDEFRIKRLLGLGLFDRVVMVIAIGKGTQRGTWGAQFRLPKEKIVHEC